MWRNARHSKDDGHGLSLSLSLDANMGVMRMQTADELSVACIFGHIEVLR